MNMIRSRQQKDTVRTKAILVTIMLRNSNGMKVPKNPRRVKCKSLNELKGTRTCLLCSMLIPFCAGCKVFESANNTFLTFVHMSLLETTDKWISSVVWDIVILTNEICERFHDRVCEVILSWKFKSVAQPPTSALTSAVEFPVDDKCKRELQICHGTHK